MRIDIGRVVMQAVLVSMVTVETHGQEFFYDQDKTYPIAYSEQRISVQLDTAAASVRAGSFLAVHPCLDSSIQAAYLNRGFWIYGLQTGCGYSAAAASLLSDPTVHRALSVCRDVQIWRFRDLTGTLRGNIYPQ